MEILIAIVLGVVAGLLMKALFLNESHIMWDVAFGAIGGLGAYYLFQVLTGDVAEGVRTLGIALVVAGILHQLYTRFGKTA